MKPLGSIGIVPLFVMAVLLALVVTSQAYAHVETPSADIIHSCVKKSGEVHLLLDNGKKKADKCKKKDIQLDWNAQGIQGDPGQPGQQGVQGGSCNALRRLKNVRWHCRQSPSGWSLLMTPMKCWT